MNCTALTWLTAAPFRAARPPGANTQLCHVHLLVHARAHFWRHKWIAVHRYVVDHPATHAFLVTDVLDVYVNPLTTSRVLARFRGLSPRAPLLLSTEDTCWIGRVCTRADVRRFQAAGAARARFMQSQFIGTRRGVSHMLAWGLSQGMVDDMHMMYAYILAHPSGVTMDESGGMFGTLSFADPDPAGEYMCWNGTCTASRSARQCLRRSDGGVCIAGEGRVACPLVWHANGLLSRAFLVAHPHCTRLLGRLK